MAEPWLIWIEWSPVRAWRAEDLPAPVAPNTKTFFVVGSFLTRRSGCPFIRCVFFILFLEKKSSELIDKRGKKKTKRRNFKKKMEPEFASIPDSLGLTGSYIVSKCGKLVLRKDLVKVINAVKTDHHRGKAYFAIEGRRLNAEKLVAVAFKLPNPRGCNAIRHKNGDVLDDQLDNLEWYDKVYQRRGKYKKTKEKIQTNKLDLENFSGKLQSSFGRYLSPKEEKETSIVPETTKPHQHVPLLTVDNTWNDLVKELMDNPLTYI